jgi:hypothetical protein
MLIENLAEGLFYCLALSLGTILEVSDSHNEFHEFESSQGVAWIFRGQYLPFNIHISRDKRSINVS